MAAISDEPVEGKVFTEDDWNEQSSLERNPYLILGPSLGPELNTTNAIFRDILTGVYPGIMNLSWGFVDVRDAATAHVLAMDNTRAKEALDAAVAFRLPYERGRRGHAEKGNLGLEVGAEIHAAVVVAQRQPTAVVGARPPK